MEALFRLGAPLVLAAATAMVLVAFEVMAVTVGVFIGLYLVWLVIINGGILIMDDLDVL